MLGGIKAHRWISLDKIIIIFNNIVYSGDCYSIIDKLIKLGGFCAGNAFTQIYGTDLLIGI